MSVYIIGVGHAGCTELIPVCTRPRLHRRWAYLRGRRYVKGISLKRDRTENKFVSCSDYWEHSNAVRNVLNEPTPSVGHMPALCDTAAYSLSEQSV